MTPQPVIPAQSLPSRKRGREPRDRYTVLLALGARPRFREVRLFAGMTTEIRVQHRDKTPP